VLKNRKKIFKKS